MTSCCSTLAFLEGIGGPEVVLIFFIILILFGGKSLPEFARGAGRALREFKKATSGVEDEIKRALDEEPAPRTPSTTAPVASSSALPPPPAANPAPASVPPPAAPPPGQPPAA